MLKTVVVYIFLVIVSFLAEPLGYAEFIHPQKWTMLAFFAAVSYLSYTLVSIGMRDNRDKFIEFYLASFSIRLVLMLIFIGTMLILGLEAPHLFVINFFVLYLFLTVFEITNILRKLRRFSQEGSVTSLSN
jgi:hypothetical protein